MRDSGPDQFAVHVAPHLEPGRVGISSLGSVDLVNGAGVRVEFQFIWQLTEAQKTSTTAPPGAPAQRQAG